MLYKKKERISYFKHNLEIDFGYTDKTGISYRGNAYMYMGRIAIALRHVPDHIKNLVELDMPKSISRVLKAKQ
jgi:Tfp pilus assembly pilus retraction ATPase PilT